MVLTQRADDATRAINRTLALYLRRLVTSDEDVAGRLPVFRHTVRTPGEYLALPHVLSVSEAYAREALLSGSRGMLTPGHKFRDWLWKKAEAEAEDWSRLASAWKEWHGIYWSACPHFDAMKALFQVRNAIVHGLGELTRKQLRGKTLQQYSTEFSSVGVGLVGKRVVLGEREIRFATQSARGFVEWLDQEGQAAGVMASLED